MLPKQISLSLLYSVHPLSPNTDQHQISPHHISAFKHIEVMRIKELITEDQLSWCSNKFPQLVLNKIYEDQ